MLKSSDKSRRCAGGKAGNCSDKGQRAGRRKSGHPIVLNGKCIGAVLSHGGEGGLRGAIEALGLEVKDVECDDALCCIDADRPADYELLKKLGE